MMDSLDYECGNILLTNKNNFGIINYKEISQLNIKKYLNSNNYYSSNDLWNICLDKYKDKFNEEVHYLNNELNIDKKTIIRRLRYQFQYRIYESSIIEAICIYNIRKSKDYILLNLSDDDDYYNKIDIRFINKITQIIFHLQIKKWNKNYNKNKINKEKQIQKRVFGEEAIYFEIDFEENEFLKRRLIYKNKIITFYHDDGKSDRFNREFTNLLNSIHQDKVNKIIDYYLELNNIF